MAKVVKTFSYDSVTDADLDYNISQLERGELSGVVRDALRAHFGIANGVTLHMILREVQALGRKLDNGVVMTAPQIQDDEDTGEDLDADLLEMGM